MDITEIEGFDNLHAPEGILLELEKRASRLYGAQESFCLVGGSTCGILSAISAALPMGGHILMARNCHRSAYHGAYLRRLKISYLFPPVLEEFGIADAITPKQVREALEKDPGIGAVLIVSPTYEGRIARVREIAEVVHDFGKILIVDEAHGAHLGLTEGGTVRKEPENSCRAGADLVIHSVHKTLPAMTQTALLHVVGPRVDREKLRRFLRIYQSSSPSYVLMASVDNALTMVEEEGGNLFGEMRREFSRMLKQLQSCRVLRFLAAAPGQEEPFSDILSQDMGKLVIHTGNSKMSGKELYDRLREKYHLQLEMAAGAYCLAMFTIGDTQEGYERMTGALLEIDGELQKMAKPPAGIFGEARETLKRVPEQTAPKIAGAMPETTEAGPESPEIGLELTDAWDQPREEVPLEHCAGRMAAEFVNLYPPGIPLLVPGERFTEELCGLLRRYWEEGLNLQGVSSTGTVSCIKLSHKGEGL